MNRTHTLANRSLFFSRPKRLMVTALFLAITAGAPAQEAAPIDPELQQRATLSAARNALALGNITGALTLYQNYLTVNPNDAEVALELAGVMVRGGEFEAALPILEELLKNDPANPAALQLNAVTLSRTGRLLEAIEIAESLEKRFPDDMEIRRLAAGFRGMQGDTEQLRALHEQWAREGVRTTADWAMFLQLLVASEDWDKLLNSYEENRNLLEATDSVRLSVIRAYLAGNEVLEAKALIEEMERFPAKREGALLIADRLASAGELEEAIAFLTPMAEAQPTDAELLRRLALVLSYDNRIVEAIDILESIPFSARNEGVLATRAEIYRAAGLYHEALRKLDTMAEKGYDSFPTLLTRAGVLYDLHREWEIPKLLQPILQDELDGNDTNRRLAFVLTSLAQLRAGDTAAARVTLGQFETFAPNDIALPILRTLTTTKERRTLAMQNAELQLGSVLQDFQPGLNIVRPSLLEEVPAPSWERAWDLNPVNHATLLKWADSIFDQGRIEEAKELYETAARYEESRSDALLGLIACALRMKDEEETLRLLSLLKELPLGFRQNIQAVRLLLESDLGSHADYFMDQIPEEFADHPEAVAARTAWLIREGRQGEGHRLLSKHGTGTPAEKGVMIYQLFQMGQLALDEEDLTYRLAVDGLMDIARSEEGPYGLDAFVPAIDLMIYFNQYAEARSLLDTLLRQWPEDQRLLNRATVTYIRMDDLEETKGILRAMQRRRPMAAEPRLLLARLHLWMNHHKEGWEVYQTLLADYPDDILLEYEYEAKRNTVLGRNRKAEYYYTQWLENLPGNREARLERADTYFVRDLSVTAAEEYRFITYGLPRDPEAYDSLKAAERRTNLGLYGEVSSVERRGRDGAVDVGEDGFEVGVLFPRGPDGLQVGTGLELLEWSFDNSPNSGQSEDAVQLRAHATQQFHNGMEWSGELRLVESDLLPELGWDAVVDIGYRGLDGWKMAFVAGREVMRDNYYTLEDGLSRSWLGVYGQWWPVERLQLFGQARFLNIDSPSSDATLPDNENVPASTQSSQRADTFKSNSGYDVVLEAIWTVSYFPRNLNLWANTFVYETSNDNLLYWTPDGTFVSTQVGLLWRHAPWHRTINVDQSFYYGINAGIGADTESSTLSSLFFELGWDVGTGLILKGELGGIFSDDYDEQRARAYLEYRFD